MRVEQEWRDAEGSYGEPEVYQVGSPDCHRDIEEHDQGSHAQVYTRARESRKQYAERYACGSEPTSCCNIPSASECQIAQDGMRVNLCRKDFKDRGAGHELFP